MSKKVIYGFVNGGSPGWYHIAAVCEDGETLAGHTCSDPGYGPHDIGVTSDWKREAYAKHCPDGFEVVWVDNPDEHPGLTEALRLHELAKKRKAEESDEGAP